MSSRRGAQSFPGAHKALVYDLPQAPLGREQPNDGLWGAGSRAVQLWFNLPEVIKARNRPSRARKPASRMTGVRSTCAFVLFCFLPLDLSCSHRGCDSARVDAGTAAQMGPRVVSRPPAGVPEYYVEVRHQFDHVAYAAIIASRVGGKIGYIYKNFHAFTIHSIPDSVAEKIRRMPEVLSVKKSSLGTLD